MKKKKNTPAKKDKKTKKELYWILGVMAGLIVIFLISSFAFNALATFEYNGLTFTKEKFGEIPVYHYYYFFNDPKGKLYQYNLYLRKDPRKNTVPITGNIILPDKKFIYISINTTGLEQCPDSVIATSALTGFLTNNQFTVKGATPIKELAEELKVQHATCENLPNNVVILIQEGNETKIEKENMCHTISVANCEILDAVEKFQVQAILDAKSSP